ncbi:MAG: TetR/AcrR family transcriptional regulator [Alphaproteobacteria bacterium]|nr:TetR/AcrR family transcriptional regulator [Alphaproteobacteria bacterium]
MQNIKNTDKRKTEIIAACRAIYQNMNFKDITIKEISAYTSFSRPSIYNYFQTKESIFLEILRTEYSIWCDEIEKIIIKNKALSLKQFADKFAKTIDNRPVLLKLLAMNLYDLESNCSLQDLTVFKQEYKRAINTVNKLLTVYFPQMSDKEKDNFLYTFFPFMFGLYPYANVTEKQKTAMKNVGLKYPTKSVYEFVYQTLLVLLNNYK